MRKKNYSLLFEYASESNAGDKTDFKLYPPAYASEFNASRLWPIFAQNAKVTQNYQTDLVFLHKEQKGPFTSKISPLSPKEAILEKFTTVIDFLAHFDIKKEVFIFLIGPKLSKPLPKVSMHFSIGDPLF